MRISGAAIAMGILRYWLTGERDEVDRERLVINLYNRRRKVDPSCKNAPHGDSFPLSSVIALPECLVLEIVEAYTELASWGLGSEEALARIESYRSRYFGAAIFRGDYDLVGYLDYRLAVESTNWPRPGDLSWSLIQHAIDRIQRFFATFPPTANAIWSGNPFETIDVPIASLLAPIDDLDSERRAVLQNERQSIDQLQMFYQAGDSNRRFLYNIKGAHWVYQGYALLRGASIAKAVIISETRYNFSGRQSGGAA